MKRRHTNNSAKIPLQLAEFSLSTQRLCSPESKTDLLTVVDRCVRSNGLDEMRQIQRLDYKCRPRKQCAQSLRLRRFHGESRTPGVSPNKSPELARTRAWESERRSYTTSIQYVSHPAYQHAFMRGCEA
jgi:hypothetical protein